MSWFGDVISGIGSFLGSSEGASAVIQTAGALGGAAIAADANRDAAEAVAQAEQERAAAIRDASLRADQRYQEQSERAAPGTERLRGIIANPGQLTPEQQRGLEDARRDARASLAASGLRGAGRAVTAALQSVDDNFRSRAIETNIGRADQAARQLSSEDFAAGRAGTDAMYRGAVGGADATARGAYAGAGAATTNAGLRGQALGDVASIVSDEIKTRGRQGRYDQDNRDEEQI